MSLHVYLTLDTHRHGEAERKAIFVRENGATKEITREEWDARYPGREPVTVTLGGDREDNTVYSANITHNLGAMAAAAGIYKALWRPEETGLRHARDLIQPLKDGLARLQADPETYKKHDASNGWGVYEDFVPWVARYLGACIKWPEAEVSVSR